MAPGHLVGTGEEGFDASFRAMTRAFWRGASAALALRGLDELPAEHGLAAHRLRECALLPGAVGHPSRGDGRGAEPAGSPSTPRSRASWASRCSWESSACATWAASRSRSGGRSTGGGCAARGARAWEALPRGCSAYDARPDAWDDFTFYFRDGTAPRGSAQSLCRSRHRGRGARWDPVKACCAMTCRGYSSARYLQKVRRSILSWECRAHPTGFGASDG